VWSSSKDGMAAVVADSSIEAGRERSINPTPIRATTTIAEIVTRFMASLRFRALNVSVYPREGSPEGSREGSQLVSAVSKCQRR
jgi:hypothetical protein